MAFFATMAFSGAVHRVQAAGDDAIAPKPCYARMVICGGGYNAYHCDAQPTGTHCGTYDKDCFFC